MLRKDVNRYICKIMHKCLLYLHGGGESTIHHAKLKFDSYIMLLKKMMLIYMNSYNPFEITQKKLLKKIRNIMI